MMAGRTPELTGPLLWIHAITVAKLDKHEKHVCLTLTRWLDFETGDAFPSVGSIATACSMTERGVANILGRLREKRVVVYPYGRHKGGRTRNGLGKTNVLRMSMARLLEIRADPDLHLVGEVRPDEIQHRTGFDSTLNVGASTPNSGASTLNAGAGNAESRADKQTRQQTNEKTTTTRGGAADPVVVERLIEMGISETDAQELCRARPLTDDLLDFVEQQAARCQPTHLGRYARSLLRKNPRELDGWLPFRSDRKCGRRKKRVVAYGRILAAARKSIPPEKMCRFEQNIALIRDAWPTRDGLADSGALSDDELFATDTDPWRLFVKLARTADAASGVTPAMHTGDERTSEVPSSHEPLAERSATPDRPERSDTLSLRGRVAEEPGPNEQVRAQVLDA